MFATPENIALDSSVLTELACDFKEMYILWALDVHLLRVKQIFQLSLLFW